MKNTLLAACTAALCLSACKEKDRGPTSISHPSSPPAAVASVKPDAGTVTPAPSPTEVAEHQPFHEPLAVEHEHRGNTDHLARAHALQDEGDLDGALVEARRALHDDGTD